MTCPNLAILDEILLVAGLRADIARETPISWNQLS